MCKRSYAIEVAYRESDLYIVSDVQLDKDFVRDKLVDYYTIVEDYIKVNPKFKTSLSPLPDDSSAHPVIRDMLEAAQIAGVGPFSAVAGAIATYVGRDLLAYCSEVMVENGGDIFLKINEDKKIGFYLGKEFKQDFITVKIKRRSEEFGLCSSSAHIGPSLNFGMADLVSVVASSAPVADAFATSYSNRIKEESDIIEIIAEVKHNSLITGILIAFKDKLYIWGELEIYHEEGKSS